MLHGKINTGKRLAALALCGLFALQAPAVPAMAAETLTVQDQGFYRSDGTKIEGAVAKGVTISKYQNQAGPIDWDAMKADGVTFAMIRVGYLNDLDPYFKENMEGAISHGIRWMKRLRGRKPSMCWNRSGDIRFPIRLPTM